MALCEFDEEIIHEGVDELKTDLADYVVIRHFCEGAKTLHHHFI
ncbi:uncharacterized protein G2W53_009526 [Senna tora]|uniref:Uncharacterized protein n=1 Tax=Senna tora TaxID=362788 RepID=A0A834WY70_9FABA|nr:uncharacterized protein G2W53_009526 [Senna tora]